MVNMMGEPNSSPNECGKCAHDLKAEDNTKGHKEVGGALVCRECGEVCQFVQATSPAAPTTPPPAVVAPPQNVEQLAKEVATKMGAMRDEMIWKTLRQPGVIIRMVDGGFIIENRWGEEAVRVTMDDVLSKAKEWLVPR